MSNKNELINNQQQNNLVEIFSNKEILAEQDWKNLASAKDFIRDNFSQVPMYRPLPVKLFGVLNDKDFPTAESKYWQCKVEAEVHAEQLMNDIHDLESLKIAIEKADYLLHKLLAKQKSSELTSEQLEIDFDIREHKVNMSRLQFKMFKLQKQIKYRIEEIYEWKQITETLKEKDESINVSDFVQHYVNKMKMKTLEQANKISDKNSNEYKEVVKMSKNLDVIIDSFRQKQAH